MLFRSLLSHALFLLALHLAYFLAIFLLVLADAPAHRAGASFPLFYVFY